jgi:hypothetical protein
VDDRSSAAQPFPHALDRKHDKLEHAPEHELEDAGVVGLLHGGGQQSTVHATSAQRAFEGICVEESGTSARCAAPHGKNRALTGAYTKRKVG